jgi:RNA polymerase sigma factor (sigma-70 family)
MALHNEAMSDVTRVLEKISSGDPQAAEQLLPLVYNELRKLAAAKLAYERPGQTLQATALVHEAYLRLVGPACRVGPESRQEAEPRSGPADRTYDSRGHFFAAAAEAMRRILVEQARHKKALKAGGGRERLHADEIAIAADEPSSDVLDLLVLDEALQKLECENPRKAQLVKLRYFAGLTMEQAAEVLGVAPSTASADWAYAKSWLRLEMHSAD